MNYVGSWNSLKKYPIPDWLINGKFGIYTHWGIYSVPACGPNVSWYPCYMYREGTPQYQYHCKNYGHPSMFGYKDFIPMFTGEKFDADEWAELFKRAGAKFAGPVGEHHDGFSMWNSRINPWNSVRMGPKADIVGKLEKAVRAQGMKYMVALHHAENWRFFPHWIPEYDTADPRYAGLYGQPHNLDWDRENTKGSVWDNDGYAWFGQEKPGEEYMELWLSKTKEVIDAYMPDLLWFDFGIYDIYEYYKKKFMAYYYNRSGTWGKEVVVVHKHHHLPVNCGVVDLELGRFDSLTYHYWMTDTTVDDGEAWGYMKDARYKSATSLIHYLIDNVSKNGFLLLNVGPKPDGKIPEEAVAVLEEMGKWLELNGEAIYHTTPWIIYGEGPTKMTKSGSFSEGQNLDYCPQDIRFTVRDDILYCICLAWPQDEVVIKSLVTRNLHETEIESVKMLGVDGKLLWKMTEEGLKVQMPENRPCKHAYVIKIERKRPFSD